MDHLLSGMHQFRTQVFEEEREFYEKLAHGQSPSALFISCSDSRIDPNLILQAGPGELFALRNAGNIVPPYGASNGGEAATIEYAVSALGVRDIVVCGHSQCGAIKAMLDPASTDQLPLVRSWLGHAEATRRIVTENYTELSGDALLTVAIQEHVLIQLENIQTHPAVAVKLQRGELSLHAWVYHLETGDILSYASDSETFEPLRLQSQTEKAKARRTPGSVRKKKSSRK
ncbi:MAG: carbonic anhydrase [Planctomycetaceae bacterium]|nr:carbonic anhydrase [Planctomycetaceae bacterium]